MTATGLKSAAPPAWQLAVTLVGFPALYIVNSFAPWSAGLFGRGDRAYYFLFFLSTMVLHWLSVGVTLAFARQSGLTLGDLGLSLSRRDAVRLVARLVAVGVAFTLFRYFVPYSMNRPRAIVFFPTGLVENLFFVVAALNAGFCEELIYRGWAITGLQARGMSIRPAVLIATTAFVFIHGLAGVFAFPLFFIAGLIYASIYLRAKSLVPAMAAHAFYDMTAILVP